MRHAFAATVAWFGLTALLLSQVVAVADEVESAKEYGPGNETTLRPSALSLRGDYFIGYVNADPAGVSTVVSLTNLSDRDCNVSVDWIAAFESVPSCTTTSTIPPGGSRDHCARDLSGLITLCNEVCDPELVLEGKAIVTIQQGCRVAFGIDARLYHTTVDGQGIEGIGTLRVVRIRPGRGNKGD
jgi:hypothetical protein